MFGNLSGPTLLVILFIVLLLFGAPKLPALAKSLGQSMKILKKEVTADGDEAAKAEAAAAPEVDSATDELAKAKAEAEAAKAEAAALREAAEKRASDSSSDA